MSEQDNFNDLKRLLKLKQHEVPPPGYFNHFSSDVIARIREGETGGNSGLSWLATLLQVFEAKPGIIGAAATSLCLLLLIGVVMADRSDSPATATVAAAQPTPDPNATPVLASTAPLLPASENSGITISSNAAAPSVSSLQPMANPFGQQQQNPLFQSASFMPGQ
ncbi:MAG TPA: hypothetical protein VF988_03285 [Verrucomicrobiae bacterium]